jgi:hypothetical protein
VPIVSTVLNTLTKHHTGAGGKNFPPAKVITIFESSTPEDRATPEQNPNLALRAAARNGDDAGVAALLAGGADVNYGCSFTGMLWRRRKNSFLWSQ